ncbi:hypothetical protein BDR06DRAFT_952022 [Suillus hirtellus]|nr:hypothetical protein BDR06DRAFT_952022 [Suillus hirtellus]
MNIYAASFLIPLGVCIYVILGGLCTTFLWAYSQAPMMLSIVATDAKTVETCIVVLKGLGTWREIFPSLIEGKPYLFDVLSVTSLQAQCIPYALNTPSPILADLIAF